MHELLRRTSTRRLELEDRKLRSFDEQMSRGESAEASARFALAIAIAN